MDGVPKPAFPKLRREAIVDNIIRIGTVNSIDAENGMVSVIYQDQGGKVTQLLPYLTFNNEYNMPSIGQMVLVASLSNGSEMGVVLGTFWNQANAPGKLKDYYKELGGDAFISYDGESGNLTISAEHLIFKADGSEVTLKEIKEKL